MKSPRTRLAALLALLVAGVLLAGCHGATPLPFRLTDLTGHMPQLEFNLTSDENKPVSAVDYRGKVVLLFFGYTHCPDVCPTTMAELTQALQQLGPDAKRVQVLFVTIDPERDTPQVLSQYVHAFDPSFVGLRPSDAQLAKVAKDFRVYYAKVPGKTPDSYTMNHTAASYVFDPSGTLRLFARDGQGVQPWVHDLKLLLD